MKPPPFAYADPETLSEALDMLEQHGEEGKVLAGGQSLVPLLNMRLAQPDVLIDLNRIESLAYIRGETRDGRDGIVIGAMTRQQRAGNSPDIRSRVPLLAEGIGWVGHPQIRNRGTVGGSIAHADPAAELPLLFRALDGEATVRSSTGERAITAHDFFLYAFTPALEPTELLTEVWFPALAPGSGYAFLEVARRHGDFALVAAAVVLAVNAEGIIADARLALAGVAPVPLRAIQAEGFLRGQSPTPAVFREAGRLATEESDPSGDIHADAGYRRDVAGTLTFRALARALERTSRGDA